MNSVLAPPSYHQRQRLYPEFDMMETTMYEEPGRSSLKMLKRNMTLDLSTGSSAKQPKFSALLASPDLNMLKLGSPELEKLIIQQQNGQITTTPTPTQFICPRSVTEEQEAYARGFVDALAELHKTQPDDQAAVSHTDNIYTNTTTTLLPSSLLPSTLPSHSVIMDLKPMSSHVTTLHSVLPPLNSRVSHLIKEEPQTVPCLGNTPPLSPIDMGTQEKIKLERKRARNRVAARKCRTRKLERIDRLEIRVNELKDQNVNLASSANTLRDQVAQLKKQIMEHVNSGCQVMLTSTLS